MNGQYTSPYVGLVKVILTLVVLGGIFGALVYHAVLDDYPELAPQNGGSPAPQPQPTAAPNGQPSAGSVAQALEQMAARAQPAPQQDPELTRAQQESELRQKETLTTAVVIALLAGVTLIGLAALILAVHAGQSMVIRAEAKTRREQELEDARKMWKNTPARR